MRAAQDLSHPTLAAIALGTAVAAAESVEIVAATAVAVLAAVAVAVGAADTVPAVARAYRQHIAQQGRAVNASRSVAFAFSRIVGISGFLADADHLDVAVTHHRFVARQHRSAGLA